MKFLNKSRCPSGKVAMKSARFLAEGPVDVDVLVGSGQIRPLFPQRLEAILGKDGLGFKKPVFCL